MIILSYLFSFKELIRYLFLVQKEERAVDKISETADVGQGWGRGGQNTGLGLGRRCQAFTSDWRQRGRAVIICRGWQPQFFLLFGGFKFCSFNKTLHLAIF